jgi:hypothetical protein
MGGPQLLFSFWNSVSDDREIPAFYSVPIEPRRAPRALATQPLIELTALTGVTALLEQLAAPQPKKARHLRLVSNDAREAQ